MSNPKLSINKYYSKIAKDYDTLMRQPNRAKVNKSEIAFMNKNISDSESVLDVGCGTGAFLLTRPNKGIGIDDCPEMVKIAKQKGINAIQGSATNLPYKNNEFDYVTSFKTLPHVKNYKKMFKEMTRVAKKGIIFDYYSIISPKFAYGLLFAETYIRFDNIIKIRRELKKNNYKIEKTSRCRGYVSVFAKPETNKPNSKTRKTAKALSYLLSIWFLIGLILLSTPNSAISNCQEKCSAVGYNVLYDALPTKCFCRNSLNRQAAWVTANGKVLWEGFIVPENYEAMIKARDEIYAE